jgi:arylsulfatase A-like enzyme
MESEVRGRQMPLPRGQNKLGPAVNQAMRQNYTAMCENIDRLIGLYLDKLSSRGELDNTIIVFSADHGDMLGDNGRNGKNQPYRASASVPLIVAGPGMKRGATSAALVTTLDLTATFLDYGGAPALREMDSKSLRPVLEGKTDRHREVVLSALGAWRMAYDGQYKVIRGFDPKRSNSAEWTVTAKEVQGLPPMVFDEVHDPWEEKDLADSIPSQAQKLLEVLPVTGSA